MPAMYPEELRDLRARHPELQYDFRGNVIGATPLDSVQQAANAIYQLPGMQPDAWSFGPTRYDFQHSKDFVGPMPQQWWDLNGELAQRGLGALMLEQDLPDVGFYSQWDPDTNSWVRHGSATDGLGMGAQRPRRVARPGNPYAPASPERPYSDYSRYEAYGLPYPYDHDDGSGEYTPRV